MMMRLADFTIELVDRIVVVRLVGEVDMSNAGELGSVISDWVTNEMLGLALDVTNLEYIDSAGIQLVFELRTQLKNRGQEMRLVVPAGATIAKTLQIVDIPRIVGVSESTQEAIESIVAAVPHPS
jgi:anti-sigma B factor antagonist